MVFKKCSINQNCYGTTEPNEAEIVDGMCLSSIKKIKSKISQTPMNVYKDFFTVLSVCNTVVVDKD
jgi:hypothetical protein